jgi:hypothetical protein
VERNTNEPVEWEFVFILTTAERVKGSRTDAQTRSGVRLNSFDKEAGGEGAG